jgi:hypothetical protein
MNYLQLAHHHSYGYGGGWVDWMMHIAVSSLIHAMVYGVVFRILRGLSLPEVAALVGVVLVILFAWGRSRDRRGW